MQNVLMQKLENNKAFRNVVTVLKDKIANASPAVKVAALQNMSEAQFVECRLNVFYNEIQKAVIAGYALDGAMEIALKESLTDLEE